jgi:deazaflavin-dependent oxidoreductase (nitroreductase family)
MSLQKTVMGNLLRFHHELYVRSGGRIGQGWLGVPCLMLTSTGAKSGLERVSSLNYAEDGDDLVLVASKGGAARSPAWYFNVRTHPAVTAQVGTHRFAASARIVSRGEADYDRLWKLANARNRDRYNAYQRRTERPIPIVVLTPTSS